MSFILDALKKSENERQQQSGAEFATVPTSAAEPRPLRWIWVLGVLLAINLAVLIGVLLRTSTKPPPAIVTAIAAPATRPTLAGTESAPTGAAFAEQVAIAERNQLASEALPIATAAAVTAAPTAAPVRVNRSTPRVPTIDELLLDGSIQLPELRIDLHVFSDVPADRFVFINSVKHRERSKLAEGPVVEEITRDGVILRHQGKTFLLPRE
jgi:general secretion pathway protein B